jgi:PKD repeat protein
MRFSFRRFAIVLAAVLCTLGFVGVVLAAPPSGDFDFAPSVPDVGQSVAFTAKDLADIDGGTPSDVTWNFGDGTPSETGLSVSHQYGSPGDKSVTMTIADPEGVVTEATTVTKTVHVNAPPSASFGCTPAATTPGQTITCTGVASPDPEGSPVSYAWDSNEDGFFDDGSDRVERFSYDSAGTKIIRLRVTDAAPNNASSTSQQSVTITPPTNRPPTAQFSFAPTNPNVGDLVNLNAAGSTDPEDQPLTYAWDLDGDGQFTDAPGSSVQTSTRFNRGGNKTVQLRVTDPQGNADTETKLVPVTNRPPTATPPTFNPTVPNVGQSVSFTGSGADPDGQPLGGYEWDFNYTSDNFTVDAAGQSPTLANGYATAGSKTVAMRVFDAEGLRSAPATSVVDVNGVPVADIGFTAVLPTPNPNPSQRTDVPLVGQSVSFDGRASDDGPTPLTYLWDFGDGTPTSSLENPAHTYTSAGLKTVTLTVTDSNTGNPAADSHSVSFRVNTPPVIVPGGPGFIFDPQTPIINQDVQFAQRFSDPDGSSDPLTYGWDFDNDGQFGEAAQTSGIACQNVQSPNASCTFNSARTYPIALRVTDTGGISLTETRQVRIQASVPSGDFSFDPVAPIPGQAVTFSSTAATSPAPPPGKEILKREWDFDYNLASFDVDAAGVTVSRAFSTAGPKTVALRVTEGVPGSAPETQGEFIVVRTINVNAPPQASFNVSPASPFDGDNVTFSSTAGDPDDPLVQQQWDLDGDGQFDDAAGAVVSKALKKGAHTARLRVTDSRGATATAERRIDVLERPLKLLTGVKVTLFGNLTNRGVKLKRLLVRTPGKASVKVTCKGRKCPKSARAASKRPTKTQRVRFKNFERAFPAGTLLTVTVTRPGYIGQQTTIKIRSRLRRYIRRDRCLRPDSSKPIACPDS